ncbi:MAG: hypothetical protein HUU38_21565 [Anaerolineales bacterium]|nr:hypothetical protein [Anaerolineales bacterium]
MLKTDDPFYDNRFIRNWVLASILALITGTLVSWYSARWGLDLAELLKAGMRTFVPNQGVGEVVLSLPVYIVTTTSVGAMVGVSMAFAQWLVLRKWVNWAKEWLVASLLGALLSYAGMAALNILAILLDPDPRLLKAIADSGFWLGAIMGLAQWRVLRKYTSSAFWWIVASVGLWGLGSTLNHLWGQQVIRFVSGLMSLFLRRGLGLRGAGALRLFTIAQLGLWTVAGAIGGGIAGKLLAWLMHKPLKE